MSRLFFLCADCYSSAYLFYYFLFLFFSTISFKSHFSDFSLHLKGSVIVSFWSSLSTFLSIFLIYYFVMWAEFACIELLVTKPEWNKNKFATENGKNFFLLSLRNQMTPWRSLIKNLIGNFSRSLNSIVNHSSLYFTFKFFCRSHELLQLMASNKTITKRAARYFWIRIVLCFRLKSLLQIII